MNNIGNKIKELRIKNNFTQEELAEQLNISSQAVSKWENGNSLPDISQIIPLVNIFGITSDELLGISDTSENELVDKLIKECQDYIREGHYSDKMLTIHDKCTRMLDKYPNNMRLLSYTIGHIVNLAVDIKDSDNPDEEKIDKLYKEAIRRANVVINYSKDVSQIMDAKIWLSLIYCNLKEYETAREITATFPEKFLYNRGVQNALIYYCENDQENEIKECCNNISGLIDTIREQLSFLGEAYIATNNYKDAIYTFESILKIRDSLYQTHEYTPPMHQMVSVYVTLARCYIHMGDTEKALCYLENGFEYVCNSEKFYNKIYYINNPLFVEKKFFDVNGEYYGRFEMKDYMNGTWFDSIRNDKRFIAIYEQL